MSEIIEFSTKLINRHPASKWMSVLIFENYRGEVLKQEAVVLQVLNSIIMKKRTKLKVVQISIRVEDLRLVKVNAYKRIRNGKLEKVRSHYRKY